MTRDFCEACKCADVVIYLSPETLSDKQGRRNVTVCCTNLSHVDFSGLGEALHPITEPDTVGTCTTYVVNPRRSFRCFSL